MVYIFDHPLIQHKPTLMRDVNTGTKEFRELLSRGCVDIYNPKTIRATMGSLYRMPFYYGESMEEMIALLRAQGILVYAAHLKGEKYYHEMDFQGGSAFLIGNEGNGLKKETADAADTYLKSAATCTSKAVYYKNCATCDKAGTATFEYGSTEPHSYTKQASTLAFSEQIVYPSRKKPRVRRIL